MSLEPIFTRELIGLIQNNLTRPLNQTSILETSLLPMWDRFEFFCRVKKKHNRHFLWALSKFIHNISPKFKCGPSAGHSSAEEIRYKFTLIQM